MWYYVEYNGKLVGAYKSTHTAIKRIAERGLKDDEFNCLSLSDSSGQYYNPDTGDPCDIV